MRMMTQMAVFLATLAALASAPARADTDFCTISSNEQLRNPALQRALIASGLLNAEVGSASPVELRRAYARLARLPDDAAPLNLDDSRCAELKKISAEFESFTNFREVDLGPGTLFFLAPGTLMDRGGASLKKSGNSPYWDGDTKDLTFGFDVFQNNLLTHTPIAIQNRNAVAWKNATYFYRLTTTAETVSEGIGDFTHHQENPDKTIRKETKRYFFHQKTFEHHGLTKGLYLKFLLTPPEWFEVPSFLSIAMTTPKIVDEIRSKYGAADDRSLAWMIYAESLTNIISSHLIERNGIRLIVRPAENGPTDACNIDTHVARPTRHRVRVVYGTTREPAERLVGKPHLGGDGSSKDVGTEGLFSSEADASRALHIGCAVLSAPRATGQQATTSLLSSIMPAWTTGSTEKKPPADHERVELLEITRQKPISVRDQPYVLISDPRPSTRRTAATGSDKRALLVIHGYNSSFSWALGQVARLAASSNYDDRVYMFSWPSDGSGVMSWAKYFTEVDKSEAAQHALESFITAIVQDRNVTKLDIVAHSMGSLQAIRALERTLYIFDRLIPDETKPERPLTDRLRLGQIVLVAPDVDRNVFTSKVSTLAAYSERINVYVSSGDCVLRASSWIRGIARAGVYSSGSEPVQFDQADGSRIFVIDTTPENSPWYAVCKDAAGGHADHVNDTRVMKDIQMILRSRYAREQQDPGNRSGKKSGDTAFCHIKTGGTKSGYWLMRTVAADGTVRCPKS